jgi:hypothetical protein
MTSVSLREYNNSTTPLPHVTVAGYYSAPSGVPGGNLPGGGDFIRIGSTGGSPAVCVTEKYSTSGVDHGGTVGSTTISGLTTSGLVVGELVTGDGTSTDIHVAPGTEIASIASTTVTLTLPLIGTATGTQEMSGKFTGDNNGTLIVDAGGDCYQKTDYRGDPHEFGAYGDGPSSGSFTAHDDTIPLQNWLGAYGNVSSLAPSTAPGNFGPWEASVPATYMVSQPLFCPANATIQGSENLANAGTKGSTGSNTPRVSLMATAGFSGTTYVDPTSGFSLQGVLGAYDYCRLSGIAVVGNGFDLIGTGDTHTSTIIDHLTSITGVQIGTPVKGADIPEGTVVTGNSGCAGMSGCTVTVSNAAMASNTGETIAFFGPDAVDVLGKHVTIDSFSLLSQGHYNLECGIPNGDFDGLAVKDTYAQTALDDGFHLPGPCANARLIGDIVALSGSGLSYPSGGGTAWLSGGHGIFYGATEAIIDDGVVEGSAGAAVNFKGASKVSMSNMHIQGNGRNNVGGAASAGIVFDNSVFMSICANHIEGNGGDVLASSQVYFAQTTTFGSDNITFCGNSYAPQVVGNTADVFPSYVYSAAPGAILTNIHLYEAAAQPTVSVIDPAVALLLAPLQVPQFTQNQFSGFTLANTGTATAITVGTGSAADSSNSTIIQLTSTCTVDLAQHGAGGLDTGTVQANKTYNIFAIATGAGSPVTGLAPAASCMASLSNVPAFTDTNFANSGYVAVVQGGVNTGDTTVYNLMTTAGKNLNSIGGARVNTAVWDSSLHIPSGTTISAFSANTGQTLTLSTAWSGTTNVPVVSI